MVEHVRDLDADFRAVYHLSPVQARSLPGPEFMALAYRASAYPGAVAARMAQTSAPDDRSVVLATRQAVQRDPVLSGLIDFG